MPCRTFKGYIDLKNRNKKSFFNLIVYKKLNNIILKFFFHFKDDLNKRIITEY